MRSSSTKSIVERRMKLAGKSVGEYEMMLMRRFNLKKEISSLQRSFATNEVNIKDYETDDETKEFAYEVRERAWENRAREELAFRHFLC
jgi:hypothetical protein